MNMSVQMLSTNRRYFHHWQAATATTTTARKRMDTVPKPAQNEAAAVAANNEIDTATTAAVRSGIRIEDAAPAMPIGVRNEDVAAAVAVGERSGTVPKPVRNEAVSIAASPCTAFAERTVCSTHPSTRQIASGSTALGMRLKSAAGIEGLGGKGKRRRGGLFFEKIGVQGPTISRTSRDSRGLLERGGQED